MGAEEEEEEEEAGERGVGRAAAPGEPATTGSAAAAAPPPPFEALGPATSSACDPSLAETSSAFGGRAPARRSASASCDSAWGSSSGSENGEPLIVLKTFCECESPTELVVHFFQTFFLFKKGKNAPSGESLWPRQPRRQGVQVQARRLAARRVPCRSAARAGTEAAMSSSSTSSTARCSHDADADDFDDALHRPRATCSLVIQNSRRER